MEFKKTVQEYATSMTLAGALGLVSLGMTGCQSAIAGGLIGDGVKKGGKEVGEGIEEGLKDVSGGIERGIKGHDPLGLRNLVMLLLQEREKNGDLLRQMQEVKDDNPEITFLASNPTLYLSAGHNELYATVDITEKATGRKTTVYQGFLPTVQDPNNGSRVNLEEVVLRDINTHGEYVINITLDNKTDNNTSYMIVLLLEDDKDGSIVYQVRNERVNDNSPESMKVNVKSTIKARESAVNYFSELKEKLDECNQQVSNNAAEINACNAKLGSLRPTWLHKDAIAKYQANRSHAEEQKHSWERRKESLKGEVELFIKRNPIFVEDYNAVLMPYIGRAETQQLIPLQRLLGRAMSGMEKYFVLKS